MYARRACADTSISLLVCPCFGCLLFEAAIFRLFEGAIFRLFVGYLIDVIYFAGLWGKCTFKGAAGVHPGRPGLDDLDILVNRRGA